MVVIHSDPAELGVQVGESGVVFGKGIIYFNDLKFLPEHTGFDKNRFRVLARLLVHGEETGMFLVIKTHHHAVRLGVQLRDASRSLCLFFHLTWILVVSRQKPLFNAYGSLGQSDFGGLPGSLQGQGVAGYPLPFELLKRHLALFL